MNRNIIIEKYKNKAGECPLDLFLEELLKDNKIKEINKINHTINLLKEFGHNLPMNSRDIVKKIEDANGIYELRPLPNRIFYFYCDINGKYILLHGFTKKTKKTPKFEIEKAKNESNDYRRRMKNEQ